jgi:HD superfamily phosphodiesterase
MNKLEKSLLEANERLYRAAKSPLKSHGPDHHWRVYQNAVKLAEMLDVKYDPAVLAGAAMFHDITAYYPEKTGDDAHDWDRRLAEEVLTEIDFPREKLAAAVDAIEHHGSDPKFKQTGERIETTLLRDGDKLDAFGPIGVARIVMVRSLRGDTMEQIVSDFWTGGHLQQKWDAITTVEARELGRKDYEYSRDFFRRLAEGLGPTKG